MVNFTLATSETWNDRQSGERKEKTEWHNVVIRNDKLGEIAEKYLRKGTKVYIEGSIQTRKWQDNTGADRYTTEVVLGKFRGELTILTGRGDDAEMGGGRASGGYEPRPAAARQPARAGGGGGGPSWDSGPGSSAGGDLDDEIPF